MEVAECVDRRADFETDLSEASFGISTCAIAPLAVILALPSLAAWGSWCFAFLTGSSFLCACASSLFSSGFGSVAPMLLELPSCTLEAEVVVPAL